MFDNTSGTISSGIKEPNRETDSHLSIVSRSEDMWHLTSMPITHLECWYQNISFTSVLLACV